MSYYDIINNTYIFDRRGGNKMKIKDIMTEEIITVSENDTIEKCANLLIKNNLSGLPVVDDKQHLKGIVTEGDLIRRNANVQTPAYLELLGGIIYLSDPNEFLDDVKKAMGLFVNEIMTKNVITINPNDTVEQAANLLVKKKVKRLPVLDENEKLIGIVSRKDIMGHLFQSE